MVAGTGELGTLPVDIGDQDGYGPSKGRRTLPHLPGNTGGSGSYWSRVERRVTKITKGSRWDEGTPPVHPSVEHRRFLPQQGYESPSVPPELESDPRLRTVHPTLVLLPWVYRPVVTGTISQH